MRLGRFKRRVLVVSVVLACVAAAITLAYVHAATFDARVYRIGVRNQGTNPGAIVGGRVDSLGVEVVSEAARRAGIQLQWTECPEGPDSAIRSGKAELWPMLADTTERRKFAHITDPWMMVEHCLVSKGPPKQDWNGVPVTYGLGQVGMLNQYIPGARFIHKQGEVAAIQSMCTDEADAALVMVQSLGSLLLRRPRGCETAEFRITPVRATGLKLGVGSTFAAAAPADTLRAQIGRMATDGSLTQLFDKHAVYSSSSTEIVYELIDAKRRTRLLEYGAAGLLAVLAVLLWQMSRVREARKAAVRANSAKSQFLANMSHEIRTPLNGIVGTADLLNRTHLNDEQRELTSIIRTSSEYLVAIVDDILDFSKVEAGGLQLERVDFDLHQLVHSAVKLYTPGATSKGLELQAVVGRGVPRMVNGDPLRIRQVLVNLLGNALKFTETGSVRVEARLAADPAEILVLECRV